MLVTPHGAYASDELATEPENPLFRESGKLSDRFPNILLRDQHNESFRFYDDLIKDRIVIVNFMYSICTDR